MNNQQRSDKQKHYTSVLLLLNAALATMCKCGYLASGMHTKAVSNPFRQCIKVFSNCPSAAAVDIKTANQKHRNEQLNRSIQNFLYSLLATDNDVAAKKSLAVLTELWRRHVWRDARTVNVIGELQSVHLHFFPACCCSYCARRCFCATQLTCILLLILRQTLFLCHWDVGTIARAAEAGQVYYLAHCTTQHGPVIFYCKS